MEIGLLSECLVVADCLLHYAASMFAAKNMADFMADDPRRQNLNDSHAVIKGSPGIRLSPPLCVAFIWASYPRLT